MRIVAVMPDVYFDELALTWPEDGWALSGHHVKTLIESTRESILTLAWTPVQLQQARWGELSEQSLRAAVSAYTCFESKSGSGALMLTVPEPLLRLLTARMTGEPVATMTPACAEAGLRELVQMIGVYAKSCLIQQFGETVSMAPPARGALSRPFSNLPLHLRFEAERQPIDVVMDFRVRSFL